MVDVVLNVHSLLTLRSNVIGQIVYRFGCRVMVDTSLC